jgi:hypothetical protein
MNLVSNYDSVKMKRSGPFGQLEIYAYSRGAICATEVPE